KGNPNYNAASFNPFTVSTFTPAHVAKISGIPNGLGLPGHGTDLNLGSSDANILLGKGLFKGGNSITVDVGGTPTTFQAGSHVTAAEFVAIQEKLSGGQQSLLMNSSGQATGGTFVLNPVLSPRVDDLVIQTGVT